MPSLSHLSFRSLLRSLLILASSRFVLISKALFLFKLHVANLYGRPQWTNVFYPRRFLCLTSRVNPLSTDTLYLGPLNAHLSSRPLFSRIIEQKEENMISRNFARDIFYIRARELSFNIQSYIKYRKRLLILFFFLNKRSHRILRPDADSSCVDKGLTSSLSKEKEKKSP